MRTGEDYLVSIARYTSAPLDEAKSSDNGRRSGYFIDASLSCYNVSLISPAFTINSESPSHSGTSMLPSALYAAVPPDVIPSKS